MVFPNPLKNSDIQTLNLAVLRNFLLHSPWTPEYCGSFCFFWMDFRSLISLPTLNQLFFCVCACAVCTVCTHESIGSHVTGATGLWEPLLVGAGIQSK